MLILGKLNRSLASCAAAYAMMLLLVPGTAGALDAQAGGAGTPGGVNGVALQKGLEFSPDAVKVYRMPFQTCLAQGCSALLVMADDEQDLQKSPKGTITVYALNGQAVQAVTELTGFADGLAALDKRRAAKP